MNDDSDNPNTSIEHLKKELERASGSPIRLRTITKAPSGKCVSRSAPMVSFHSASDLLKNELSPPARSQSAPPFQEETAVVERARSTPHSIKPVIQIEVPVITSEPIHIGEKHERPKSTPQLGNSNTLFFAENDNEYRTQSCPGSENTALKPLPTVTKGIY